MARNAALTAQVRLCAGRRPAPARDHTEQLERLDTFLFHADAITMESIGLQAAGLLPVRRQMLYRHRLSGAIGFLRP